MAWDIEDHFPPWGDAGERPADNFQYDGGDQVNEKHFDYLWNEADKLEKDVEAALKDIDSDKDGIVDEADTLTAGGNLKGDLKAVDGEIIWDESATEIPDSAMGTISDSTLADPRTDVSDSGTAVLSDVTDINFSNNLSVTDDGDGSVTVDAADVTDTRTDVSESGTTVVNDTEDMNFRDTGDVTTDVVDDGDGTVSIDARIAAGKKALMFDGATL